MMNDERAAPARRGRCARVWSCGRPLPRRDWVTPLAAGLCAVLLAPVLQPLQAREAGGRTRAVPGAADSAYGNRETLTLALNQSRVIKLRTAVARVSVAAPNIADILVLDPHQIYVVGKEVGSTNLILWDTKDQVRGTITLDVTPDLELLKSRLHEVLPGERIQVRSAQGAIVVGGTVSSPQKAEAAVQIAQSFADAAAKDQGKGKVLNMIQIGGSQQVMLEVRIAEVSRDINKKLDLNLTGLYSSGGGVQFGTIGPGSTFKDANYTRLNPNPNYIQPNPNYNPNFLKDGLGETNPYIINGTPYVQESGRWPQFPTTDAGTWGPAITELVPGMATTLNKSLFLQSLSSRFMFNMVLDVAKNNGLARILAEPNLTTLSGQEANFLAGGQFPYAVPAPFGQAPGIAFKNYGVQLQFVPVVLESGVISLKVSVSVSALDPAVVVSGTPGLKDRSANATVEVKSGETISIAGLINETLRENVNKFPGLGDIPILGMLFRSQEFVKGQTELVIFVTPRLARAFDPQQVKLPTDSFVEPSDLEFYLMGRTQGRKRRPGNAAPAGTLGPDKSGSEGAFGHDL